eukprot:gene4598-biopygen9152
MHPRPGRNACVECVHGMRARNARSECVDGMLPMRARNARSDCVRRMHQMRARNARADARSDACGKVNADARSDPCGNACAGACGRVSMDARSDACGKIHTDARSDARSDACVNAHMDALLTVELLARVLPRGVGAEGGGEGEHALPGLPYRSRPADLHQALVDVFGEPLPVLDGRLEDLLLRRLRELAVGRGDAGGDRAGLDQLQVLAEETDEELSRVGDELLVRVALFDKLLHQVHVRGGDDRAELLQEGDEHFRELLVVRLSALVAGQRPDLGEAPTGGVASYRDEEELRGEDLDQPLTGEGAVGLEDVAKRYPAEEALQTAEALDQQALVALALQHERDHLEHLAEVRIQRLLALLDLRLGKAGFFKTR